MTETVQGFVCWGRS